jgi:hypothetical protein
VWQRNVEGGTGNGTFDVLIVGAFAAGVLCELIGIPLLAVGLTGPESPPGASSSAPRAAPARSAAGTGLAWTF